MYGVFMLAILIKASKTKTKYFNHNNQGSDLTADNANTCRSDNKGAKLQAPPAVLVAPVRWD